MSAPSKLEGASGSLQPGLSVGLNVMKKKATTEEATSSGDERPPSAAPQRSLLGLDRRAVDDVTMLPPTTTAIRHVSADALAARNYRQPRIDTPSHPGGVSASARQTMQTYQQQQQRGAAVASSSYRRRDDDRRRDDRHDRGDRDDRRRDYSRRDDRDDRRSYDRRDDVRHSYDRRDDRRDDRSGDSTADSRRDSRRDNDSRRETTGTGFSRASTTQSTSSRFDATPRQEFSMAAGRGTDWDKATPVIGRTPGATPRQPGSQTPRIGRTPSSSSSSRWDSDTPRVVSTGYQDHPEYPLETPAVESGSTTTAKQASDEDARRYREDPDYRAWVDEEKQMDRDWYQSEEGGLLADESHNPFAGSEEYFKEKEEELVQRQVKKLSMRKKQFDEDHSVWEKNLMVRSGIVQRGEIDLDFTNEEENRVHVMVGW